MLYPLIRILYDRQSFPRKERGNPIDKQRGTRLAE